MYTSFAQNTYAQESKPAEYQVKAAFLYNFAKFVNWPSKSDNGSLSLYVLGNDPFGKALDAIEGKIIRGERLLIKRIRRPRNLENCSMLYISSSEKEKLAQIIDAIKGLNILTVGDTKGYTEQGVIINLYTEKKKVRFEINNEAAKNAKLEISSKLLNLARIIK